MIHFDENIPAFGGKDVGLIYAAATDWVCPRGLKSLLAALCDGLGDSELQLCNQR